MNPAHVKLRSSDPDQELLFAFEKLCRFFRAWYTQEGKRHDLSPVQVQILIYLLRPLTELQNLTILANEFFISKASLSESIKGLMNKKLVTRLSLKSDKRVQYINLTRSGKKLAGQLGQVPKVLDGTIRSMKPAEKQRLMNGVMNMMSSLRIQAGRLN
jgi:DNA-binding MarR family transcriptional regulator